MNAPKRILIVDDEKEFLYSASLALRQAGYDVRAVGSPVAAIDTIIGAFRKKNPFDLLVTDQRLPTMSGGEMVEKLRRHGIPLHVLLISGTCEKGVHCTMDCSCGSNHLGKPFEPREFLEKVGKIFKGGRKKTGPTHHRPEGDPGNGDLA